MSIYTCRHMRKGDPVDRTPVQALCERSYSDFAVGIRQPTQWSLHIWEKIDAACPIVVEDSKGKIVGFLLLLLMTHYKPPAAVVQAWTTDSTLPHNERVLIGLHMLLFGYDDCVKAELKHAYGETEATNAAVRDTLDLIENFTSRVEGRAPATPDSLEREPKLIKSVLDITPEYQAALKAAIEKFPWNS